MTQDATAHAGRDGGRSRALVLLLGLGGLWTALAGVAISDAADANAYGIVFGSLLAVLGLLVLLMLGLEARQVRRRPGVSLGTSPDGLPATVVGRARWAVSLTVAVVVALASAALAAGVVAFSGGDPLYGGVLVAVGLWLVGLLVPVVLGGVHAGGLYLTRDGLVHHKDGGWWRVRWEDVDGVVPGEPLAVVLHPGAEVARGRTARWGWSGTVRAPEGVLGVHTRHLAEDPDVVSFLVLAYRDRPDLRGQLGTPESLSWEILRPT